MSEAVRCHGCGDLIDAREQVRWLERESAEALRGDEATYPARAYTHLGHELPGYRIVGRSRARDVPDLAGEG